jgi:uncharacterized membrane protein YphA (DoxX/SURF4 family)
MENELKPAYWSLRLAFGLVPIVAGVDKFFNLLTNWEQYVSPLASGIIAASVLMKIVGVIEIAAGLLVLSKFTRIGAYVVAAWLIGIALNLLTTGHFFDIAVRDVVLALGAFTLAKLEDVRLKHAAREPVRAPLTTATATA